MLILLTLLFSHPEEYHHTLPCSSKLSHVADSLLFLDIHAIHSLFYHYNCCCCCWFSSYRMNTTNLLYSKKCILPSLFYLSKFSPTILHPYIYWHFIYQEDLLVLNVLCVFKAQFSTQICDFSWIKPLKRNTKWMHNWQQTRSK